MRVRLLILVPVANVLATIAMGDVFADNPAADQVRDEANKNRAQETPRPANAAANDAARVEKTEEEFKFRYKRPKQRHDDDEAPVPKIVKPALSEAPGATEK